MFQLLFEHLSIGFCNHSPPCSRGMLRRRCAPGSPALAPLRGPPSTFLSVDGGCFRTSRGPAIDVFNFGGGRCRTCGQHPQEAHHRRLQLRWWPLPDLPPAPPRGPAIDVFNFGGGRCQKYRQHPRGPAINVFNFDGGRCRKYRQHPQGARHRRLQFRWWSLLDLPLAPPEARH
jgi:hypothetical protein